MGVEKGRSIGDLWGWRRGGAWGICGGGEGEEHGGFVGVAKGRSMGDLWGW